MNKFLSLALTLTLLINPLWAKRLAPAHIEPIVSKRGTVYQSFERNSDGYAVYLVSKDKAGDVRWKKKIFSGMYNKELETDVQDVHLKSLSLVDTDILAVDELGRKYRIDIIDGSINNK